MNLGPPSDLTEQVRRGISEDVGDGDVTSSLIPEGCIAVGRVVSREPAVLCGCPWFDAVFAEIDPSVTTLWNVAEGALVAASTQVCTVRGPARSLLSGERTALNFLQMLSGTATITRRYVDAVAETGAHIIDTRKTIPGLRSAQKYAVRCGGGINHRLGLYDAYLIKENHVEAMGGLTKAIAAARSFNKAIPLMAEAEDLEEVRAALDSGIDVLLVDELSLEEVREAVSMTRAAGKKGSATVIEYSGNATLDRIRAIAETGVDRISVGALTKHVHAIDLSMRLSTASD